MDGLIQQMHRFTVGEDSIVFGFFQDLNFHLSELAIAAVGDVTKRVFGICGKPEITYFGCEYFRQSLQYHFSYCTSTDCSGNLYYI